MQAVSKATHPQLHNKGSIRRRRLVMLILTCFLSWAGITLWNQTEKINDRKDKVSMLQQKLDETKQAQSDAQREITRLNDPEYVEQIIRKELQYVKEGETLFYTPQTAKK
ncbi:septum formation initiator family protein [Paenibacillus validus]|uniref:Septum formation initiator family protein n=1 Tax=Paenibacillus validus TaxID=44253 RepID=A0A7X3CV47_9BACL|nr:MULTISPECIES: septum formation initiator family protein [Paenibacillus]MED4602915.1 septum formation initiator family protein [Paenibacillus validus]MED4608561.1 septum formation initiator family protein [Paenibacillus validus]MUG73391.1 septum formation initiator family protein [Paenibacillus validus]